MTPREAKLFGALYDRLGHLVQKYHLIDAVYGGMDEPKDPYMSIQVMFVKIRRLLEGTGYAITNWYGESYSLTFDASLVADGMAHERAREAA